MTASVASTARPEGAAIAWATKDALFVEIPSKNGAPYIVRYRKTVEGLSEALNILIEHQEPAPRAIPSSHPLINAAPPPVSKRAPWAGEKDRARVQEILKRLKITA